MLNTKTLSELVAAQNSVLKKHNLSLIKGISQNHIGLEDGIPWIEAEGNLTKAKAKQFAQELADAMNIRVIFNRLDNFGHGEGCVHVLLDISPDDTHLVSNKSIPANSDDPDAAEFMEDYGNVIYPTGFVKPKKKSKRNP